MKPNELSIQEENIPQDRTIARTFIDETIEKIKNDEARKTTFQFKSSTRRFNESQEFMKNGILSFLFQFLTL